MSGSCFCKTLRPTFAVCRIFGLFPITWSHTKNSHKCLYKKSIPWILYSLILCSFCVGQIFYSQKLFSSDETWKHPLPVLMSYILECFYALLATLLILCHLIGATKLADVLTDTSTLIDYGLMCKSSRQILLRTQYVFIILLTLNISIQMGAMLVLNISDKFTTNWGYDRFVIRFVYNVPFIFYLAFCGICATHIAFFGCFEKLLLQTLDFKNVHATAVVKETNNRRTFFGCISYKICDEEHNQLPSRLSDLEDEQKHVVIDFLRIVHEKICVSVRDSNDAMNPQLLFLMTTELAVLVVHFYSVIIYMKYESVSMLTKTINFMNWMFIGLHTGALLLFLRGGHQVTNLVNGLTDFLFEFSTRHLGYSEHMQIRIFLGKLRYEEVKLQANNVFNITLSLVSPICGNVLTYVLVAIQFQANDEQF